MRILRPLLLLLALVGLSPQVAALTDDFTAADNTVLGGRVATGGTWTQLQGSANEAKIVTNRLVRTTSAGGRLFYATGDDGSTSQTVNGDILAATNVGLAVLGSVSGGTWSGYYLRAQTGLTSCRLFRINADGTPTQLGTSGTLTNTNTLTLSVVISGGNPVFTAYQNGVALSGLTNITDSSASKLVTGQRGIVFPTVTTANPAIDNYSDNYAAPASITFSISERPAGFPSKASRSRAWSLTYTGTPASILARWVDTSGNAITGQNFATVDAAPSGGASTFSFASPAAPGDYRLQVRDDASIATVTAANFIRVGKIIGTQSQSQGVRLFSQSDDLGSLAPTAGIKCTVVHMPVKTNPTTPTFVDVATGSASLAGGIVARANQIWADNGGLPFTLVEFGVGGTSVDQFIDNLPEGAMTWGCWDYVSAVALAIEYQLDALVWYHGTTDVGLFAGFAAKMVTLVGKYDTLFPGENFLIIVHPHPRSDDGAQAFSMRQVQYTQALAGGRWRLGAMQLDNQLHSDADPHQKAGATGQWRIGTRFGRAEAHHIYNTALDKDGPQWVSAQFTDTNRNVIEVTFNKAGETPSGATTGLPGFVVSTDNGSTFSSLSSSGLTCALTASNKAQLTKSGGGSWPAGTTRIDYLRGTPFASDVGSPDYVGSEASMEIDYLSKVITDTTSFDGGRGMPMAPVMGTGFAVSEAGAALTVSRGLLPGLGGLSGMSGL